MYKGAPRHLQSGPVAITPTKSEELSVNNMATTNATHSI